MIAALRTLLTISSVFRIHFLFLELKFFANFITGMSQISMLSQRIRQGRQVNLESLIFGENS